MTFEEFTSAIAQGKPCPNSLPPALQGLWIDKQGDWDTAHQIVQNANDKDSAWVHAYLHREEGDIGNARFWYGRAGKPAGQGSLAQEWEQIAQELLAKVASEVGV
ncbi:MAG: hypothetical protein BRC33_10655 [Cyanobacteria bacterium SW_9_44_58]|nr:MAG: hypothetical protein BRC33_10655 [Cyanobacteria bacterium SW_9_44_58]